MSLVYRTARVTAAVPLVASSLIAGIRSILIEDDRWEAVRARLLSLDPDAAEWIDAPLTGDWHPAEHHFAIMGALLAEVGVDEMRSYGRRRLQSSLSAGALAPIIRSWLRSYGAAPDALLRVQPHMWNASTRNMGSMRVHRNAPGEIVFRISGTPDILRRAEPWHRFLEGYSSGLLEAGGYRGQARIELAADVPDAIDGVCRWFR